MSDLSDKPKILLMFSGGLDSTGAFFKLIKSGQKIHVHHMNLRNIERRAKAESKAVSSILNYFKPLGNFVYSESTHEYPCFNNQFVWDSDIVSFVAGNICMQCPWIQEVALGMTASDEGPHINNRIERANKIFSAFTSNAIKTYPVRSLTKSQIYESLPKELATLTWSCRTPIYKNGEATPCNICQTCNETKKLIKT